MRVALSVVCAIALAVAAAVVITAVRSDARETAVTSSPANPAAPLTPMTSAASPVTVPALTAAAASTSAGSAPAGSAPAGSASASSASASSAAAARSAAARAAAASAAAARRASASNAAASSSAASRASASSAAASRVSASSAAASSAAASRASASSSAAASRASASAAAHPAPDTSDAVEDAVDQAANEGITQSVIVMNRQTGSVTTAFDSHAQVPAMSLFKVIIAADVISQAGGVQNVDPDTLDQLHQMIVASDDSIAQGFYDQDGRGSIVTRVALRYGLADTSPSPQPRYWGDVQISAHDMASLMYQLLSDSSSSAWFAQTMEGSLDVGADGFDQDFGVNAVAGAGSKQGWGCCLGGVLAIHSMGFTADQIIVVLSTAENDVPFTELGTAGELARDPGAQASVAAVTATVQAALPPS